MRHVTSILAAYCLVSLTGCALNEGSSSVSRDPMMSHSDLRQVPASAVAAYRAQKQEALVQREKVISNRLIASNRSNAASATSPSLSVAQPPKFRLAAAAQRQVSQPPSPFTSNDEPVVSPRVARHAPADVAQNTPIQTASSGAAPTLNLAQAQCAAVNHSPLARAFDRQRRKVEQLGIQRKRLRSPAALASALLACQALKVRNDAAADAVATFIGLAELQRQRHVLASLRERWQSTNEALGRIGRQGLDVGDPTALERQQLEIQQQEIDLEHSVERLAQALHVQMGHARLCPIPTLDIELAVSRELVDVEAAVDHGLACRPDLGQLRILCNCLDSDNYETAKQLMSLLEPSLGDLVSANCECFSCLRCLLPNCNECCDIEQLRKQIRQLHHAAHELAEIEISDRAIKVNLAVRSLEVSEQTWIVWNRRVAQLEKLVEQDSKYYPELATARFSQIKAVGNVVHRKAELDMARGRLLAAQGLLARQCGCGGCCDGDCQAPPIQASSLFSSVESSLESSSAIARRLAPSTDLPPTSEDPERQGKKSQAESRDPQDRGDSRNSRDSKPTLPAPIRTSDPEVSNRVAVVSPNDDRSGNAKFNQVASIAIPGASRSDTASQGAIDSKAIQLELPARIVPVSYSPASRVQP